jgi:hypothetical protein
MRTGPYFKRASKRFLTGTRFKTPCDAVEAGAKTLLEWSTVLEEERNKELMVRRASIERKQQRGSTSRQGHIGALNG